MLKSRLVPDSQQLAVLITFVAGSMLAIDGPLTTQQALDTFKLEPGLKIELVASEPDVISPVAVAFDEKGRMYVAEDRGYPVGPGKGNPPAGKIALLEDTNGDGKYDKRTTYAEGLTFPNGVMPWKGGLYVTCAPYLYYFKDTNGDGKADIKKTVFSGFQDLSTTQLRESHPTLAIDNWIYLNCGLTAAKVLAPDCPDRPALFVNRVDFRFHPETCEYEEFSGTGQFGGTFDNFGRRFICSNRNHNQHVVMQSRYLRRNPNYSFSEIVQDIPDHGAACKLYPLSANITTAASHTGFFTSACGVTFYNGTALLDTYRFNCFTCEPAGNLVHRDVLSPDGVTFVGSRAYPTNEFIASPDNWFRPVNLTVGPDGALYLCDMYRKTIEHPDYLPEEVRKITDFQSGKDKGRIYRIIGSGKKMPTKMPRMDNFSPKELCLKLDSNEGWVQMTAHRLLLEQKDPAAVPTLKTMAHSAVTAEGRVHALHLLDAFGKLTDDIIEKGLSDKRAPVREHAIQLAEPRLTNSTKLADKLITMANDSDARVRFQCALSLGEIQSEKIVPALVKIAERDGGDKWTRAAVMSSLNLYANDFLKQITPLAARLAKTKEENKLLPLLADLGRTLGTDQKQNPSTVLRAALTSDDQADFGWQLALISGLADGLRVSHPSTTTNSPLMQVVASDSSSVSQRLKKMMDRAGSVAANTDESMDRRLAAIGLLAQAAFSSSGEALQKLIDPQQPTEIQVGAVRALSQMKDSGVGAALVKRERWASYTMPVKEAVLSTMISQPQLLDALLSAVEHGDIAPGSINGEKRNQLMKSKDEAISKRAIALFKDIKPGDRMKVYEEYKDVLTLARHSSNGHKVFTQACLPCHTFAGEGHAVGPDLTGIRNQPAENLLLHIIVPEYEIMPIYQLYNVEAKDGRSFSGLLVAETPSSITLRQPLGIEEKLQRSNIASMTASSLSLMPQELEKAMSKQDLADLIGFLKAE